MQPRKLLACLIAVILAVFEIRAIAQQSYMDEPGIPPFTTSFPVEHGFINLANGNLHLEIPIATYSQRGRIKALHARLVYDSRFWTIRIDPVTEGQSWQPSGVSRVGVLIANGWRLITDGELGGTSFSQSTQICGYLTDAGGVKHPQYRTTYDNYTYQEANGTNHEFGGPLYQSSPYCVNGNQVPSGKMYDGDGYLMVVNNNNISVYAPDGTQVMFPPTTVAAGAPTIQDTNGNFTTFAQSQLYNNVVDTLGRTPVITTSSSSGTQLFLDYLCEPGTTGCDANNGNRARVTVNIAAAQYTTTFNAIFQGTGVKEYSSGGTDLTSIVFPDGSIYQFQQDSYGMITSMTLPTGGQIKYGWTNFTDYNGNVNRWLSSRTVDGNSWSFVTTPQSACCNFQVTVTGPPYSDGTITASDQQVYTFAPFPPGAWNTQTQYFRGASSGTPILTKSIDYTFTLPGLCSPPKGLGTLPVRETLTWPTASGTASKKVEYCYDSYSNPKTTRMWDYQPNGNFAAAPDREVDTTYVTDSAYINANILRLPLTSTTLGPGGIQMAQSTFAYDGGTPQPSGITTNHVTPAGPRGNLTSVSRWLNTTGGSVTRSTAWFDTGEVYQTNDPLLNKTATYTYDSAGAYPTQVCNALSQCSYSAYDFSTGLLTMFTDANGSKLGDTAHTTTYAYDSMLRPLCTNFPDGGQTCAGYPDPNHVNQQRKVTSTLTDASATVLDDLGRVSETQHTLPNGVAKVDTTYDPVGAVATVTNPYLTTTDATYGVTQTFHDALGRTVQTTKQDCSISSVAYSISSSGSVNGPCVTTTDEAGKQRTVCHNGFGETIEVLEPGDSFAGSAAGGGLSISGTLQSKAAVPATTATASVTLSGSEQSSNTGTGAGSVTIQGGDKSTVDLTSCRIVNHVQVCNTIYDIGAVYLTVNGVNENCGYSNTQNTTSNAIASCLASALTNDANSPVNASVSGSTISMTARASGASTNYTFSVSSNWDTGDFSTPSFTGSPSSGNLSGGTTVYDSGTCRVYINGTQYSQNFGQSDSPSTIASGLAGTINSGNLASATVSGATISLTAKTSGAAGNYSLSGGNCSYNLSTFSGPSFSVSSSGSSLTGGTNAIAAATDSGTVQMSIAGYNATANYGNGTGQDSTAAAIASDLVNNIKAQLPASNPPFTISANGAGININWASVGSAGNVAVTTASTTSQTANFSTPSFASCSITSNPQNCSTTLTGGQDPYAPGIAHPWTTLYTYDGLGNLACVEQHGDAATGTGCGSSPSSDVTSPWRVRRFTYDSLSRLLTAKNPESGTISYSYDANGNLLQKTAPAPNQTGTGTQTISYCYEALNRVTGKAYSAQTCTSGLLPAGTAVVSYTYDQGANGIGHLTSLTDQAGLGSYAYDAMGRILNESRTINPGGSLSAVTKSLGYLYNVDGSLQKLTDPSGAVVTYTPWNNGTNAVAWASDAKDTGNAINYVTGATYGPDGALSGFVSGYTGAFAGITRTFSYNKRQQPIVTSASSPTQTLFSVGYDFHLGAGDNGDVYALTNNRDHTRDQTFTYDALNRLTSAQNSGTDCSQALNANQTKFWGNSYGYDAWGNLLQKNVTKCNAENLGLSATTANQLVGYAYDAAGNMTSDPTDSVTAVYDAENRIASATKNGATTNYTYDADGNRVEKANGSTGTLYWYMTPGIVAESDLLGNLQSEYVFFDDERVARKDFPSSAVSYYFSDHLKTADVITDSTGNIKAESDYYPWGGELRFTNNDSNHYKFTGKERDSETGLDYFGARYYSNGMGRFVTPDPLMASAHVSDPQSWNRYTYARNNPLRFIDPTGMFEVPSGCAKDKSCQITVKVNVIWDKTANNGKGLTDKQKEDFKKNQVGNAIKDYAKSNIKLDVTYSEGSFTMDNGHPNFTGVQSGSLNVVASNQTIDGSNESFMTKSGTSITLINVNDVHDNNAFPIFTNSTEHEMAHQFLGDTEKPPTSFAGYIANEFNVDGRVQGQHMGVSQQGFREGLEPRKYATPTNPEAVKPQQK